MNGKDAHELINSLIDKINSEYQSKQGKGEKLSLLEIDRLKNWCIQLYDLLDQLRADPVVSEPEVTVISEEKSSAKKSGFTLIQEEKEEEINAEPEKDIVPEEIDFNEIRDEEDIPVAETEIITPTQDLFGNTGKNLFDAPKFEPIREKIPVSKSTSPEQPVTESNVHEKIGTGFRKVTLHDTISKQSGEQDKEHRFSALKIEKISDAIDIGKRFELQSNLFGGNSQHYSQAMHAFEQAGNKFSALELFSNFAEKYHWDQENELVQELRSLINRRF